MLDADTWAFSVANLLCDRVWSRCGPDRDGDRFNCTDMVAIIFWLNAVAIVAIGVGVILSVARDLLVDNRPK